jgi:hypothetical protein
MKTRGRKSLEAAMPIPPKRRDPSVSQMIQREEDIVTARRRTWAGWLDECAEMQDRFDEAMLEQIRQARG